MQKLTFSPEALKDIKGEVKYTQETCPDALRPLVEECLKYSVKEHKSYTLMIGVYGRESKTFVSPASTGSLGRTVANFGARELYTFYEKKGGVPDRSISRGRSGCVLFSQTLDQGEMMFLEPDVCTTTNLYVSATPRRKLTINGKSIANIRAPGYKRYTAVIDWS